MRCYAKRGARASRRRVKNVPSPCPQRALLLEIIAERTVVFGSVYHPELRLVLTPRVLYSYSSLLTEFNVVSDSESIFSPREATSSCKSWGKPPFPSKERQIHQTKKVSVVELACCQFKPRPQTGVQSLVFEIKKEMKAKINCNLLGEQPAAQ